MSRKYFRTFLIEGMTFKYVHLKMIIWQFNYFRKPNGNCFAYDHTCFYMDTEYFLKTMMLQISLQLTLIVWNYNLKNYKHELWFLVIISSFDINHIKVVPFYEYCKEESQFLCLFGKVQDAVEHLKEWQIGSE